MRHHGEIVIHTRVPAAVPLNPVTGVIVPDVVALTGRADECARTAAEAGSRKLFPFGSVKLRFCCVAVPAVKRKRSKRKIFHNSLNFCLFGFDLFVSVFFGENRSDSLGQFFTLFGKRLPIKLFADKPCGNVRLGLGRVDTENRAEAAFFGFTASRGNDRAVFTPCLVERVGRLGKENLIKNVKRSDVAGTDTENNGLFRRNRVGRYLDFSLCLFKGNNVFALREEHILGGFYGFEFLTVFGSGFILCEVVLTCLFDGEVQPTRSRNRTE